MVMELMGFFDSFCWLAQSCKFFDFSFSDQGPFKKGNFLETFGSGVCVCVELR